MPFERFRFLSPFFSGSLSLVLVSTFVNIAMRLKRDSFFDPRLPSDQPSLVAESSRVTFKVALRQSLQPFQGLKPIYALLAAPRTSVF